MNIFTERVAEDIYEIACICNTPVSGLQCHAIKNKKPNRSINQIKKLGCER